MEDVIFKSIQTKASDTGELEAVFSTFGVVDRDGDIVEATAFTHGQAVPMTWAHDWARPVGKGHIEVGPKEAVFRGGFFLDTQDGSEAYKTVKAMGDLQEYSWGFRILDATWETRNEEPVRIIKRAEVFEVSPVLVGAGVGTRTLGIKSAQPLSDHIQAVRDAVGSIGERVRSVVGLRGKEGRSISPARSEELKALAGDLRAAAAEIEAAITPVLAPAEGRKLYSQFLQTEARLNGVQGD